jgi:hypothetical protein
MTTDAKTRVKQLLIRRPWLSVDELMEQIHQEHPLITKVLVSSIRMEFRHTWHTLHKAGLLELSLEAYEERQRRLHPIIRPKKKEPGKRLPAEKPIQKSSKFKPWYWLEREKD